VEDREQHGWAWREHGQGPVALLLHGLGGSRLSWDDQLAGISGRRLVAWDLPGYGAAEPLADMSFGALADAVVRFIDELGAAQVDLAGISFGGMIAQHAAARHPARVRTLAILSSSPKFGLDGTQPDEWIAARLAPLQRGEQPADFAEEVLGRLVAPGAPAPVGQIAAMRRVSGAALERSIRCIVQHDSRGLLGAITAPTLVMVGELDHETPTSYAFALADAIPGARMAVVRGAGHLLNAEAPEAVNDLLAEHWEAHP
jgi:3-oxoadipate enol-lactonase